MIEGLNFDVTADELATHLASRVEHHKERVAFYEEKIEALREKEDGAPHSTYSGNQNPVDSLTQRAQSHRNKVELFEFMGSHLVNGEVYRLDESELAKVEFISDRWR